MKCLFIFLLLLSVIDSAYSMMAEERNANVDTALELAERALACIESKEDIARKLLQTINEFEIYMKANVAKQAREFANAFFGRNAVQKNLSIALSDFIKDFILNIGIENRTVKLLLLMLPENVRKDYARESVRTAFLVSCVAIETIQAHAIGTYNCTKARKKKALSTAIAAELETILTAVFNVQREVLKKAYPAMSK